MIALLLEPFGYQYMLRAIWVSALVGGVCAFLSCFLMLKGWSLMGDAISHAVFPGVVLAYIIGLPLALGAFAAGMFCAVATGYLKDNSRIKQDTVMGIVFSGMFGVGLVLYVKIQSEVHLDHILFGDMLGVSWRDIGETALVAIVVAAVIAVKWRDFLLHAFDPVQARAVGLPVGWLHYGLLCLISLTIVGALTAVGLILAIAMLIAPGAIAFLLTRTFGAMLAAALAVAVIASLLGVYLSFFLDSAPAPTIVLLMSITFIAALLRASLTTRRIEAGEAG